MLWAAKLLHPDKFPDVDLRVETKQFYSRFFHYALSESELDSILDATVP